VYMKVLVGICCVLGTNCKLCYELLKISIEALLDDLLVGVSKLACIEVDVERQIHILYFRGTTLDMIFSV
jgi:hypothetical protein